MVIKVCATGKGCALYTQGERQLHLVQLVLLVTSLKLHNCNPVAKNSHIPLFRMQQDYKMQQKVTRDMARGCSSTKSNAMQCNALGVLLGAAPMSAAVMFRPVYSVRTHFQVCTTLSRRVYLHAGVQLSSQGRALKQHSCSETELCT